MPLRSVFALCVVVVLISPAAGQRFRPPKGRQPPKLPTDPFAADGTVQAVLPPRIRMLTNTEQVWIIWVDPKATVHVRGTAEADFLSAGMFVRFTAEIDKRGVVKDKVTDLTIFTPSEKNPIGIWPEGAGPVDKEDEGPGGFGGPMGGAMQAGPSGFQTPASTAYTVAGRITGARRGKFIVNAGRGVVRFELAEEPKIQVDFADYRVAKQGDKISITKGKMLRGQLGVAQAEELTIELSEPLGTGKKKVPRAKPTPKRSPPRPGKQPPDAEQSAEPPEPGAAGRP